MAHTFSSDLFSLSSDLTLEIKFKSFRCLFCICQINDSTCCFVPAVTAENIPSQQPVFYLPQSINYHLLLLCLNFVMKVLASRLKLYRNFFTLKQSMLSHTRCLSEQLNRNAANHTDLTCMHRIKFNVHSDLVEIHSTTLKAPLQAMSDQCTSYFICPHGTQSLFCHPNYCSAEL